MWFDVSGCLHDISRINNVRQGGRLWIQYGVKEMQVWRTSVLFNIVENTYTMQWWYEKQTMKYDFYVDSRKRETNFGGINYCWYCTITFLIITVCSCLFGGSVTRKCAEMISVYMVLTFSRSNKLSCLRVFRTSMHMVELG